MEQKNEQFIPSLPENAPFTPEQRAYLNGFLAGILSRAPAGAVGPVASAETLAPLTILFGSQTGNAENLAKRIAKEAGKRGFAPTVHDLARYPAAQLATEESLLIVTSTYGDGEPPDNAKVFWDYLNSPAAPKPEQTYFSVCALGDSNYPKFCGFGKDVDLRLESLGGQRVHPRIDCDVDFDESFTKWLNEALMKIGMRGTSSRDGESENPAQEHSEVLKPALDFPSLASAPSAASKYSRSKPFPAALVANKSLNALGSSKDTRHFEFALDGSGLAYEAGDALGVIPTNCPGLVKDILAALKYSGGETVQGHDGTETSLREALLRHYEITKIPQSLLAAIAERSGDEMLKTLAAPGANGSLTAFLHGREIIDLLLAHPAVRFVPTEFASLLKKLQPRLYSISSSPKAHPARVHLTVNIVRFESLSRKRKGVCSTFLAERVELAATVPVFVHSNKNFRPPAGSETPIIMVGPGTGIAPFRAFLQERSATGANGRNWLFFGDQRSATDFMYRDELEALLREGVLTRLDTAFSRDQAQKIYVQDRMREHAKELFVWLEAGAHFFVCGDAKHMAKDVDAALHEVVQVGGNRTPEQAAEYISRLRNEKRYQRDVY